MRKMTILAFLRLDQNEDRQMLRMLLRPSSNIGEAGNKSHACAAHIDILHMQNLESRLVHHMLRIELRVRR